MILRPSRRDLVRGGSAVLAAAAMARSNKVIAANTTGVRVGASRWDAWYNNVSLLDSWYAQHNLDPAQYQLRAPFFAQQVSTQQMSINGNSQAVMDAEITYANAAGLKYWAFLYYDPAGQDADFGNALALYQSSTKKSLINWCWIHGFQGLSAAQTKDNFATLAAQLGQTTYEKVLSSRPLFYITINGSNTPAQMASTFSAFRTACQNAGVGNPYIVLMSTVASDLAASGADALSDYAYSVATTYGTYASLAASVQAYWATRKTAGANFVPVCMTGWDRRPRIERPVPWEIQYGGQKPFQGMSNSFAKATPTEIVTHIQAGLTFVSGNTAISPAQSLLVYSWNEFDEGGWLCPTWTATGADNTRLTALTGVI